VSARELPAAVKIAAQAKINLRLRIVARETSGYHQIETLFLRIALADDLRIRRTSGARTLDVIGDTGGSALGPVERNLAWRAAQSYAEETGMRGGFAIELEKRIPIGGGLGGGSADAGAVLRALDAMAERPLGESTLIRLAAALGSDVPFLASEHAFALAWGRGERMLALSPPPVRTIRLFCPDFGVSTADAYSWLSPPAVPNAHVIHPPQLDRWESLAPMAVNDFEPVVAARHPAIRDVLAQQRADPSVEFAMLSGSGSSMVAVLRGETDQGLQRISGDTGMKMMTSHTVHRVEPPTRIE
jgi:4-diphosphocytidyl-2-C-methyl-D-erythritol kinase